MYKFAARFCGHRYEIIRAVYEFAIYTFRFVNEFSKGGLFNDQIQYKDAPIIT